MNGDRAMTKRFGRAVYSMRFVYRCALHAGAGSVTGAAAWYTPARRHSDSRDRDHEHRRRASAAQIVASVQSCRARLRVVRDRRHRFDDRLCADVGGRRASRTRTTLPPRLLQSARCRSIFVSRDDRSPADRCVRNPACGDRRLATYMPARRRPFWIERRISPPAAALPAVFKTGLARCGAGVRRPSTRLKANQSCRGRSFARSLA